MKIDDEKNRKSTNSMRMTALDTVSEKNSSSSKGNSPDTIDGQKGDSTTPNESLRISIRNNPSIDNEDRQYDIVIFAASSLVGQFLVEELALVVGKMYPNSTTTLSPTTNLASSRKSSVPSGKKTDENIRWALAGRSPTRLNETLCRAELNTGIRDLSQQVPTLLADLNKDNSLINLCKQTRLIINCAGPYSETGGELLIKAALECGTHYLDLSHETAFNERIRRTYTGKARERGIFILQGCGFQSMSSEMGLNFTKKLADGQVEQVKIILSLNDFNSLARPNAYAGGLITPSMWQSLLADKAQETLKTDLRYQVDELQSDEKKSCVDTGSSLQAPQQPRRPILERKDTHNLVKDIIRFRNRNSSSFWWPSIRFIQRSFIRVLTYLIPDVSRREGDETTYVSSIENTQAGYVWPIDSLTSDETQLISSEMIQYELSSGDSAPSIENWRPIRCSSFISLKSFAGLCFFSLWLFSFQLLVKFSLARYFMGIFPRIVTLNNTYSPSGNNQKTIRRDGSVETIGTLDRASLSHIKFSQTFIAYGTPNDGSGDPLERVEKGTRREQEQLLVSRVVGPEPNHVATATFAIQAALTLLLEKDHLPRLDDGHSGGVLTPGVAFADTNIIHKLRKRNIKFEVLKKA